MDSLYDYSSWMEGIDLPNLSVIADLCGLQPEAGPPYGLQEREPHEQFNFLFSHQQDAMVQPDWSTILPSPSRDVGEISLWPADHSWGLGNGDWDQLPVCSSPPAVPEPGAHAVSTVPPPLPCTPSDDSLCGTPQNNSVDESRPPSVNGPARQGRRGRKPKRKPYARESHSAGPSPPAMSTPSLSPCTASPSPMTPTLRLTSSRSRNAQHEISPDDIERIVREAASPVAACPFCDKRVSHGGLQRHLRTHAAVDEYCIGVPVWGHRTASIANPTCTLSRANLWWEAVVPGSVGTTRTCVTLRKGRVWLEWTLDGLIFLSLHCLCTE